MIPIIVSIKEFIVTVGPWLLGAFVILAVYYSAWSKKGEY